MSGTVTDQSGAAVPNAAVTLKNEASNDLRQSTANGSGYFTFSAVQPGAYSLKVEAKGFQAWEENGIAFTQGASITVPNISLKVGSSATTVDVITSAESIVPQDTGEVATTLDSKMVNNLPIVGRDAGELLRIMPGMALANGLTQGAGFTDQTVGTNSGPIGSYSPNGQQPNGSMAYMLDGANLLDPGNQGTQIANINADMTAEVKVLMSGYDAAYAKGPVVFQAISKSGGAKFHGEAYLYARNNIFNSEDAYQRSQGQKKVDAYQYYPGGNIGGPVVLPFVKFNRNRDKLFFWFGYEYMRQQQAGTLWQTFVPTADMRAGNFSPAVLNSLKAAGVGSTVTAAPCATPNISTCGNLYFPNGIIPSSLFDPQALALLKTYPMPNIDPATHSGHNYQYLDQSPQNRWEQTEKIDYSPTENTKVTFSYARQVENDLHPVQFWWSPGDRSLPSPSPLAAPTTANVVMANVTHVFGPTLTNETVFTYARYINPLSPTNPKANDPATYGFSVPGLFGQKRVQLPNIESWSGNGAFAGYYQQGVFGGPFQGGAFGGIKKDPALYDNLSKVAGTHTMKFGVYWDANENVQSNGNDANGTYFFETYGSTTTSNLYADLLLGRASQYQQGNAQYLDDLIYHQYSLYAQDSWKVNKRLTLNYGGRADHIGQWYPASKQGAAVFDIGKYVANPTAPNAGLLYHSIDSKIPISGFKSPLFYYEPRVGFAYDIFGTGKTVLRGGFAVYRYQLAYNTTSGPADLALGGFNYTTPTGTTSLSQITNFSLPAAAAPVNCGTGCSVSALQPGDGKTPYTENYSFSIDQALPGRLMAEISYVGNRSRDLLWAGDTNPYNLNQVPLGAFFGPDPITGQTYAPSAIGNSKSAPGSSTNDYRPYQTYGNIDITTHGSYANFNSLQVSLARQAGSLTFTANYTYGKALGTHDNYSGNGPSDGNMVTPFSIPANYGLLGYNHTQILNGGYVWTMPNPIKSNVLLKGIVNGWQLSGTTSFQTGAPIQPNTNGNLYANYGLNAAGGYNVSTQTWLGSNAAGLVLVPQEVCDPGKNLKSGQYFNPSCFAPPAFGSNGTLQWGNIHGPAFFDSDLTMFKIFHIKESQSVEFRASAFNFLNRPNPQFGLGGNSDLTLNFANSNNVMQQTNQNAATTGSPAHTTGNRTVQFAVKYYF